MNERQRYVKFAVILAVIVALAAGGWYGYNHFFSYPSKNLISDKPELVAEYDKALEFDSKIKQNPTDPRNYLVEAMQWKGIGDVLPQDQRAVWYRAALKVYERGIKATNRTNTLLMSNAATIDELLGDLGAAKSYYQQAIEISPGDASYYISLINVMHKMNATPAEILPVFQQGMDRVVGPAPLFVERAHYLKTLGRYDDAKADLQLLLKNKIITQQQYDSELRDLHQ